jgi:hypothetical protein
MIAELIGERQQQDDERLLVSGLDLQDVAADAFRFGGLVQEAVSLGPRERRLDGIARQRLQLELHGEPPRVSFYRTNSLKTFRNGS